LSPPAVERIAAAPIDELIITNSLPLPEEAMDLDKITVLSVGPILAGAVSAIFADASVSDIFQGENI
jgi:ribose-phosphate pyrophosphokinase